MANYLRRKVQCMDCGTKYFEMVLNGEKEKFNFRCRDCSGRGIPMFGRKTLNLHS